MSPLLGSSSGPSYPEDNVTDVEPTVADVADVSGVAAALEFAPVITFAPLNATEFPFASTP